MVFLHPHESGIRVGLGVAVPVPALMDLLVIFLQLIHVSFQGLDGLLQLCLPLPGAMDESDPFLFFDSIQFFPDFLQRTKAEPLSVKDEPDTVKDLKFFHQDGDLLAELFLVLCDCLFPDKGIAVCRGLDLCPVNEDMNARDLPQVFEQPGHFGKGLFGALG